MTWSGFDQAFIVVGGERSRRMRVSIAAAAALGGTHRHHAWGNPVLVPRRYDQVALDSPEILHCIREARMVQLLGEGVTPLFWPRVGCADLRTITLIDRGQPADLLGRELACRIRGQYALPAAQAA